MSDSKTPSSGIGLPSLVFIVFLILKLIGKIDWSWWWVTSPLWIPACLLISAITIIATISVLFGGRR